MSSDVDKPRRVWRTWMSGVENSSSLSEHTESVSMVHMELVSMVGVREGHCEKSSECVDACNTTSTTSDEPALSLKEKTGNVTKVSVQATFSYSREYILHLC